MPLQPNNGHRPCETITGKRIRVRLRNGYDSAPAEPAGWPIDGIRWTLENNPFDIVAWEPVE